MSSPTDVANIPSRLPGHAQVLAEKGSDTEKAIGKLVSYLKNPTFLAPPPEFLSVLSEVLKDGWNDSEAAKVITAVLDRIKGDRILDLTSLAMWIRAHRGDAQAVRDCLLVDPPGEMTILQLLSRAGSQKLVFLANWQIAQREIVLKRFIGDAERLLSRELQPHPLSMDHPNIIETHMLRNRNGEGFLAERRLPVVLNDTWESHGINEAANLLRDIASALAFLRDKHLVHGDVKPDNIGFEEGNYILLDFGICRPQQAFAEDPTPTGSLRTRAPEVLLDCRSHTPASDIWSLGATVYNAVVRRFPLFREGEVPPRISNPKERSKFEKVLAKRVNTEWETCVDLNEVPEPLRGLLARALDRDPDHRITAGELVELAERELAAFLRANTGLSRFSPAQEIQQFANYLPSASILALMPDSQKHELRKTLDDLKGAKGLTSFEQQTVDGLLQSIV